MDAHTLLDSLVGERARFVAVAQGRVGERADAEDIVQRALHRAAERAASVEDPSRARAWFYRLLRNTIVDHHRERAVDRRRRADGDVDELVDAAVTPEPVPCRCAARLLDDLHASYGDILRRIDVGGENPTLVATELGISRPNLDVRLHRARKRLRDGVTAYCGVSSHRPCLDCSCDGGTRCHSGSATSQHGRALPP